MECQSTTSNDSADESRFGAGMTPARNVQVAFVGLYLVSTKVILDQASAAGGLHPSITL